MSARRCEICKFSNDKMSGSRHGTTYCDFWHFDFNNYDCCQLFQERNQDKQITFDEIIGGAEQ